MTKLEKQVLQKTAISFGYNLSEYIRRKLFHENSDIANNDNRYVSIASDKHNALNVSILYKVLYLVKEILTKQGCNRQEISNLEQKSLNFARKQREEDGYKVIESSHE